MRVLTLAALLLAGCAVSGNNVTEADIAKLWRGMTGPEVRARLGTPTSDMVSEDGARRWIYTHGTTVIVPFYASVNMKHVTLIFRDGKLDEIPGYELRTPEPDAKQ